MSHFLLLIASAHIFRNFACLFLSSHGDNHACTTTHTMYVVEQEDMFWERGDLQANMRG